jgi:hypothetical protein
VGRVRSADVTDNIDIVQRTKGGTLRQTTGKLHLLECEVRVLRKIALQLIRQPLCLGSILLRLIRWQIHPILGETHDITMIDMGSAHVLFLEAWQVIRFLICSYQESRGRILGLSTCVIGISEVSREADRSSHDAPEEMHSDSRRKPCGWRQGSSPPQKGRTIRAATQIRLNAECFISIVLPQASHSMHLPALLNPRSDLVVIEGPRGSDP